MLRILARQSCEAVARVAASQAPVSSLRALSLLAPVVQERLSGTLSASQQNGVCKPVLFDVG